MARMFKVYGIGQATLPVLPPPVAFENAPTSNQDNYEIGQMVYTPPTSPTAFFLYGGAGNWIELTSSSGPVQSVVGTANQITVSTVTGTATVSLPSAITAPGSLATTTTLASGTTLTAGTGLTVTTGGATVSSGNIVATLGNITASAGNIAATVGSVAAGTTVTGGTGVTATTGNVTASAGNLVAAGTGNGLVLPPVVVGAGASPQTANGRSFSVTFSSVSIAAGATQSFVINNTAVNTLVQVSMVGATSGAALTMQSITNSAGVSTTIVVTNGTGATTSVANITFTGLCIN